MASTNITNRLSQINEYALNSPEKFIEASELRYSLLLESLVHRIESERDTIVMLAGPSAAGKTTSANKLKAMLADDGITAHSLSLDDFYAGTESAPRSEDGTPDFESVHALDLPLIAQTIKNLLTNGCSEMPIFDFHSRSRKEETNMITLGDGDVVIIEGIHALNPAITDNFPPERLFKLYVNVASRIYDDNGEVLFNKRDLRLLRRIVRDSKHRNSPAEYTFGMWKSVVDGENKYLFPFEERADFKLNSFHAYEPCVIRDEAIEALKILPTDSPYSEKASELVAALEKFSRLPLSLLPQESLLREFIG